MTQRARNGSDLLLTPFTHWWRFPDPLRDAGVDKSLALPEG